MEHELERGEKQALPVTPAVPTEAVIPEENASAELCLQEGNSKGRFWHWVEKSGKGPLPLVPAFLLPFLIFCVCLALREIFPFGDRQILNFDGWHQYYPFLLKLWDHFHEGTSLLYDWSMGMGTNFLSMLSYYGSSPLNLALLFVKEREFRVLFTLLVALRIGLAGLFSGMFLRKIEKNPGWSIAFFSLGYALCGFLMGYYWNVMWLDAVALFPLIALGTLKLFREGKCSLYVLSLGISFFSNYYITYMSCVFTVLAFFVLCVVDRVRFSDFLRKGFRLLLCTLLGAATSAVILLPAFFGLLNTGSTQDATPMYVSFYESIRDLLAPLLSFHEPAVIEGLPNLSTAAILVLFAFSFLWAKRIGLREKLCAFFLLAILLFSMNFSVLNYAWHGFHYTNMIPYRFAYLFAFVVVVMAYLYYKRAASDFDWIDGVGMLVAAVLVALCALGYYSKESILATVAVFSVAVVLTALYAVGIVKKKLFSSLVCLVVAAETAFCAYLGTGAVGSTSYSDYLDPVVDGKGEAVVSREDVAELIELAKEKNDGADLFYRTEMTEWYSLNDSCLFGYDGISQFSSAANRNVSAFLLGLGMPADPGSNRFVYVHGTPFANTLLGVKYLISKNGYLSDTGLKCLMASSTERRAALYEETAFAGLGFMVPESAADFTFDSSLSPYERQNALFCAMTGLEGELFTPITSLEGIHTGLAVESLGDDNFTFDLTEDTDSEEGSFGRVMRLSYTAPQSGMVYIYADVPMSSLVQVNNAWHCVEDYANFFSAGYFRENETFQLRAIIDENDYDNAQYASFDVVVMNDALWQEGLALLQDESMEITSFEETRVKARVDALSDGYLYTSIPAELGNTWSVFVDGKEAEVSTFAGAFVGVSLSAGEHEIEFVYSPLGFEKGLWISVVSLLLLGALFVWELRGGKLFPEKPLPEKPCPEKEQEKDEGDEETERKENEEAKQDETAEADEHHPEGA
ncbi:MAG: YfhO family protein [Clostridia bacterium]|nr:YfhO family protein [Clostridia bacterium]